MRDAKLAVADDENLWDTGDENMWSASDERELVEVLMEAPANEGQPKARLGTGLANNSPSIAIDKGDIKGEGNSDDRKDQMILQNDNMEANPPHPLISSLGSPPFSDTPRTSSARSVSSLMSLSDDSASAPVSQSPVALLSVSLKLSLGLFSFISYVRETRICRLKTGLLMKRSLVARHRYLLNSNLSL